MERATTMVSPALDVADLLLSRAGLKIESRASRDRNAYSLVSPRTAANALLHEPMVGLDLETTGLDPITDRIRLISVAARGETYLIDADRHLGWQEALGPLFANSQVKKVLHNGIFDLSFLDQAGVEVNNVFDTMLAAQLLDGGTHLHSTGYFTLSSVSKRELGNTLDKANQTSAWGSHDLSPSQLRYAAEDASILLPLRDRLGDEVEGAGLGRVARVEHEALPAIAWLNLSGVPFDAERWADLSDAAMLAKLRIEEAIQQVAGRGINLNSPRQVRSLLHAVGIDVESTNETVLHGVADQHEVVRLLLEHRAAAKRAGTYGIAFLNNVHPHAGRIHARYRQIGAATGRMSCSGPNLQQVPRETPYRSCFRAPDGALFVKADLSLVELSVAADLSGDDRMIRALEAGEDLHSMTAQALFGKAESEVTPEQRSFGKAVNFGTLYGQGLRGLIDQARRHGLILTETEAKEFQQRFSRAWPQLSAWQRSLLNGRDTIVRTRSGRL